MRNPFRRTPKGNGLSIAEKPSGGWKRRALIGVNALLALVLVVTIGGFGYVKWRYGQVDKIDFGGLLQKNAPKDPMTVLVVGSDTRVGESPEDKKAFGSEELVQGQRSDTIMLVRVDPKKKRAAILSIPRDTFVSIAGAGKKDRINSAFQNGPIPLAQTIQEEFGIEINHYVQIDFDVFKSIVNTLGGVYVPFSSPVRDWGYDELTGKSRNLSGLDIPEAGCVKLDGNQALSYVRSRHFQVFERGQWRSDPQSDLGRIQRQQDFIRRVMRTGADKAKNITTANALVDNVVGDLKMDKGFSLTDLKSLAERFRSLDPSTVQMMTLPTRATKVNAMDVLIPQEEQAAATIQTFLHGDEPADNTPKKVPVGSVSVRVLNGSGTSGQASDLASELRSTGFVVSNVGDARVLSESTTIRYGAGQHEKATTLAGYLNGPVTIEEDRSVTGVSVVVTLGKSFGGFHRDGNAMPPTTEAPPETTQPATTTTASPFVPSADSQC